MIAVLAAVLMVVMLGMVAFAVDVGYLGMARTQLQTAADAAALAAAGTLNQGDMVTCAQNVAAANVVGSRPVQLNASGVELGMWNTATRTFTPSDFTVNAVRVTVRTGVGDGGATPLFFANIFGYSSADQSASAVATVNPRDIAFVVDLSGSMNYDTYPNSGSWSASLVQQVYADFNFGSYPGGSQYAGQPLGVPNNSSWVTNLTKSGGPLRGSSIPARYKVTSSTSSSAKTWKAYAWVMEVQIPAAGLMPNAIPTPYAGTNYTNVSPGYSYWRSFIDQYRSSLGYFSYVKFMMKYGRDEKPDGQNYTPLSINSNLCACPMHSETVGGTSFSFPPREMPTHAARRALIAALQVVKDRNQTISDVNQRDWASIITFDKINANSPTVARTLTDNYDSVMMACTQLQACGHNGYSTGTEAGMNLAYDHIKPQSQGGVGRERTNKIVVLLTDGQPNLKRSSMTTSLINSYISNNPSTWTDPNTNQEVNNWITTGSLVAEKNASLMHASSMQAGNGFVYAAGVGLSCDYDFMDRMARMGGTANNLGQSPRGSGDPAVYEQRMRQIFEDILTNPKLRLVQ